MRMVREWLPDLSTMRLVRDYDKEMPLTKEDQAVCHSEYRIM